MRYQEEALRERHIPFVLEVAIAFSLVWIVTHAFAVVPTITHLGVSSVTTNSAELKAEINPEGKATKYHFEYGLADCASNPCVKTPFVNLPKGTSPVPVSVSVEGLGTGTTYHFRVVAENGETAEASRTFSTYPLPSANLPDGRAYEQSSPVDKDGGDAISTVAFAKAALDGSAVSFLSTSGMPTSEVPGESGAQELPLYFAGRGSASWSTRGLLPPESYGPKARVIGWTPDFKEVFIQATRFTDPREKALLERPSAGGPITEVAPFSPMPENDEEFSFVGAGADGTKVVFESRAKLPGVPGALEDNPNVYIWDKAGGELSLASVLNDGDAPSNGAIAGSYDWVNGITATTLATGGSTRDYYTQDEHTVTSTGAVYFTAAGSGQLYLRRNPTKPQSPLSAGKCADPSLACTIQVSATQKTNGKGAAGADAAGARPAAFMEATPDGSKAFFTSSEKLTNDAKTGIEPDPPAVARATIGGAGANLSFLPAKALGIALDAGHVYWANPEAGTIGRAKLNGAGNATEVDEEFIVPEPTEVETEPGIFENLAPVPRWVAVDGEHVYWTNDADGEDSHGTIGRAKIGAVKGEDVEAEFIAGAHNPQGIAVDATHIYWGNAGANGNQTTGIARADIDGDPASVLQPWSVNADGDPANFQPIGVTLDDTYVYFTEGSNIERIKLSEPKDFISILFTGGSDRFTGIAVDATHIYWANAAKRTIGRATLNNPEPNVTDVQAEFIKDASPPQGLAVDAANIYWAANQGAQANPGNDLYRYEEATGKLRDISLDTTHVNGAEVKGVLGASADGTYVYYAANGVPNAVTNSPNGRGESATLGNCQGNVGLTNGTCNLYLWHEDGSAQGATTFIAHLDISGSTDSDVSNWAGTPTGTIKDRNFRKTASVSADGLVLLFRSQRRLEEYDNEGTPQLYRYRVGEAGPRCVSCDPSGEAPTGPVRLGTINPSTFIPTRPASVASRNLAGNGNRVFFESTDALVINDTNGVGGCPTVGSQPQGFPACLDVYEWEAQGTGSCQSGGESGGCVYLLSSGKDTYPSFFADASVSGNDAFLFTRSRFVGQDKDELLDVYDARVGGGLASQNPVALPPCESAESCHGPASAPPAAESPGSASFAGPSNPKPKHTKPKQKKKKKQHKKKQQKKKQHRAHANRGARR